jgi:hypothetical protein
LHENGIGKLSVYDNYLLAKIRSNFRENLNWLFISLSAGYENFDASRECLALLYGSLLPPPQISISLLQAEFDFVECINLITYMIDQLEKFSASLSY